ncbi:unnamed protein product [Eruca vesicaria subsp. sativa]|uniref:Uncharacterized protein n=1 Tax=Eruca vesicaria subsp. sativa TaxID=29727 RepID=A0ABC8M9V7_ERUVS|nr:unnamed protein product [Eruca vesicaria subsp. sativa]
MFLPNMSNARRLSHVVPSRFWCGKKDVIFCTRTYENQYRRFYRCEIWAHCREEGKPFFLSGLIRLFLMRFEGSRLSK